MANFDVVLTDQAPIPSSGYSQAIVAGNLVVTSGYLGTHPDGSGVVKGGFDAEVRQALSNIKAVLEEAGCTTADVIRVNVSLTDVTRFPPAHTSIAMSRSVPGATTSDFRSAATED